ncbi:MAG: hypothetical protein WCG26_05445 [Chloroflexales bacterium]
MTATTPTVTPRWFSERQAQRLTALVLAQCEALDIRPLVQLIVALDPTQIPDAAAQLIMEVLTAQDHGPEETPTFDFLGNLMVPPCPEGMDEDPDWRTDRLLRLVSNAIALGLHREDGGWIVRGFLLENPDTAPAEWETLKAEIFRRADIEEGRLQ